MSHPTNTDQHLRFGLCAAVLAAVLFGAWPVAMRLAYADGANPAFIALGTNFARAFTFALLAVLQGHSLRIPRSELISTLSSGALQLCGVTAILIALTYISGPVMITILFSHTIILLFLLVGRGEAALTKLALFSSLIAIFGISLAVGAWDPSLHVETVGVLLAIVAAFITAGRMYVFGKDATRLPPAVNGARVFCSAALISLLAVPFVEILPPHTATGWIWMLVSCASLSLEAIAMFYGLAFLGPFRYSMMGKLEPLFTSAFSAAFAREFLAPSQYLGMAIVIGSLAIYQYLDHR